MYKQNFRIVNTDEAREGAKILAGGLFVLAEKNVETDRPTNKERSAVHGRRDLEK